jgi:hypothetical protein
MGSEIAFKETYMSIIRGVFIEKDAVSCNFVLIKHPFFGSSYRSITQQMVQDSVSQSVSRQSGGNFMCTGNDNGNFVPKKNFVG